MKGLKDKTLVVTAGVVLLGSTRVFAISELEIKNDSLGFYVSKCSLVEEIQKYVEDKGIDKKEYEEYIKLSRNYRYSKEVKWEAIENGTSILDHILFVTQEIKDEYEKRIKEENDTVKVYESLKKDLLNNPLYVLELIEKVLKDESKMKEVFKMKYERMPTDKELSWLMDEKSIKYALYGGELGREITEKEYSLIQRGYGYKLLGLYSYDIEEYAEYILIRDKITPLEALYYNSIDVFSSVYMKIYNKYEIDIYKVLTEKERIEIHSKSVEGIVFNKEKAYKLVEEKLREKGIISEVSSEDISEENNVKDENIIQDSSSSNPKNELNQYLGSSNSSIREALLSNINKLYTTQKVQYLSGLRNTYIYFRYKDKVVNTYIRLYTDGSLSNAGLDRLLETINETLNSKMVFSRQEVLLFVENEIKTSGLELKENVPFGDLVNGFRGVGIELYEEDIMKEEKNENLDNLEAEKRLIQIDLDNESYQVPFMEEDYIRNIDFKNMLEMMGMKYVFTTDSVLILNQGQVFVVEIDAYNKGFVTAEDIKKVLLKVGLEAAVKTINQKRS